VSFAPSRRPPEVIVEIRDGGTVVATVRLDGDVPGLFALDVLCRVRVAARRLGWEAVATDRETGELLALAGLEERRQPERREQPRVEEVVQPDEPPA